MIIDGDYTTVTIEGTEIVVRRYIRRKGYDDYEEDWQSPLSAIDTEDPEVKECLEQLGWRKTYPETQQRCSECGRPTGRDEEDGQIIDSASREPVC